MSENEDIPFGPPLQHYNYCYSHCRYESEMNEAIIDVAA